MKMNERVWRWLANRFPSVWEFQGRALRCVMRRVQAMPTPDARRIGLAEGWPEWFVDVCIEKAHTGFANGQEVDDFLHGMAIAGEFSGRHCWPNFFE